MFVFLPILLLNTFGIRAEVIEISTAANTVAPKSSNAVSSGNVSAIPGSISKCTNIYGSSAVTTSLNDVKNSKSFKRIPEETKTRSKTNASTIILVGNLGALLTLINNRLGKEVKVIKRTESNETTAAESTHETTQKATEKITDTSTESVTPKEASTKKLTKEDLHVGCIVKDHVGDDNLQFIEIPIKKLSGIMNASDEVFESLQDSVPDRLDFAHQKVYSGKEAADKLKASAHERDDPNQTKN